MHFRRRAILKVVFNENLCLRGLAAFFLVFLVFGLAAPADAQLFQRMLLFAGKFRIGDRGAQVLASCLDRTSAAPQQQDRFLSVSGDATVTKFREGQPVSPRQPLSQLLADGTLVMRGDRYGDYNKLTVEAAKPQKGIEYEVDVGSNVVVGPKGSNTGDVATKLTPAADSLREIEKFARKLSATFGDKSGISRQFQTYKAGLIWDVVKKPTVAKDLLRTRLRSFSDDLTQDTPEDTLVQLSIIHGGVLSKEQVAAAADMLKLSIAKEYPADAVEHLHAYSEAIDALRASFGSDHPLVDQYARLVLYHVQESEIDLETAILLARRESIPAFVRNSASGADLLSLTHGERYTTQQIETLNKVCDCALPKPSNRLDKHILLAESEGDVVLTTVDERRMWHLSELPVDELKQFVQTHPYVVVDGRISERFAGTLRAAGITFVGGLQDSFLRGATMPQRRLKFIFVAHETDKKVNGRLFETGDPSVKRGIAEAQQIPQMDRVFVASDAEFRQALLDSKKEGATAVAVFHNGNRGILFENPMTLDEFRYFCNEHKIDGVALSCNTYTSLLGYRTLDQVNFETVVRSLRETWEEYRQGPQGNEAEFFKRFQERYSQSHETQKKSSTLKGQVFLTVILSAAGGSGSVLGWIFGDDDRKKKKKQGQDASQSPGDE